MLYAYYRLQRAASPFRPVMFLRHNMDALSTSQSSILKSYQSKRYYRVENWLHHPNKCLTRFCVFQWLSQDGDPKDSGPALFYSGNTSIQVSLPPTPTPAPQCLWPLFGPTGAMCHCIQIRNCCLMVTSYMQSQMSHSTSLSSVLSPKLAIGRHWALYFWRLWVPPHMRVKTCYTLSACHWDPARIAPIGFVFGKPQTEVRHLAGCPGNRAAQRNHRRLAWVWLDTRFSSFMLI